MKVTLVTYSMAPYRTKQFEKIIDETGIDLMVYYIGRQKVSRSWEVNESNKFREAHLKGFGILGNHYLIYPEIKKIVRESDLILLGGFNSTASYQFTFYAKKMKKKIVFIMDGISSEKIEEKKHFKFYLKSLLINQMDAFFANGKVSSSYLRKNFSVNNKKIYNQYLTVDVDKVNDIHIKYYNQIKEMKKSKFDNKFVILYAGRLLARKRVVDIIYSVSKLSYKDNIQIVIIGDGTEKEFLLKESKNTNINCYFLDFVKKQEELFRLYNLADCFILPSEDEPWGLVVNEAISSHLPVIVSNSCGCARDLVEEGENGYTFKKGDINDLCQKIDLLYRNSDKLIDMGEKSFEIALTWRFNDSAKSFSNMIEEVSNGKN